LIQFLNRYAETIHRRAAKASELSSALVRFAQRIDRLADAKDRLYASLGNTRTDLLFEAMDKRVEVIALGLRRAQDRVDGMASSFDLARTQLGSLERKLVGAPRRTPAQPEAPAPLAEAEYVAFENRFRGSSEEIRERLAAYVPLFEGRSPVVELGCGRGEFLELAGEAGVEASGVDNNREMLGACRDRGLTVEEADLGSYLQKMPEESLGGIFAAQVIEHLPPALLRRILTDCHRTLRKGGRLVLETVNPKSLLAFVDFYRDLTHQKPIHPETLEFLLRACGFVEVGIQFVSPVNERAKLFTLPPDDGASRTLNENFNKLNATLFADQDYAAIATK
jgi:O-antigen chain-terminating methyltransferase